MSNKLILEQLKKQLKDYLISEAGGSVIAHEAEAAEKFLKDLFKGARSVAPEIKVAIKDGLLGLKNEDRILVQDFLKNSKGTTDEATKVLRKEIAKELQESGKNNKEFSKDLLNKLKESKSEIEATEKALEAGKAAKITKPELKFKNPQSQELAEKIQLLKKAGAAEEQLAPLRKQLLELEGVTETEVKSISKQIEELDKEYKTIVAAAGEDAPAAKKIKKQIEKLAGVTAFTKIKRFCTGNWKSGGLCLAILGAAGYAGYKGIEHIINPEPGPSPSPTPGPSPNGGNACRDTLLKYGCKGDNVKRLQQKLLDAGEVLPRKGVDGWFGPETKAAVMSFQRKNGLKVDGIAGPETLAALNGVSPSNRKNASTNPVDNQILQQDQGVLGGSQKGMPEYPNEDPRVSGYIKMGDDQDEYLAKAGGGPALELPKKLKENFIRRRNNDIEKLVFERLVKNAR